MASVRTLWVYGLQFWLLADKKVVNSSSVIYVTTAAKKVREASPLVPLHSGFDRLSVSRIEHGQVGVVHLDSDAPSRAGLA